MTQQGVRELRQTLAQRQREKAELELQVRTYQSRYQEELAPLREKVLRLQKECLKRAAQTHLRSARLRNAYHDADEAYKDFQDRRQSTRRSEAVSDAELKATYRRASKHCHPDAVPDSYGDEAVGTFQALESAYEAGEGHAVQAIASALQQWGFPETPLDASEEKADKKADLRQAVSALNASIERLRESEVYQLLSEAGDIDLESIVRARKRELKRRLRELQRSSHPRI